MHHFVEILLLTLVRSLRVCRNADLIFETPGVADSLTRRGRYRRIGAMLDKCIERDKYTSTSKCILITSVTLFRSTKGFRRRNRKWNLDSSCNHEVRQVGRETIGGRMKTSRSIGGSQVGKKEKGTMSEGSKEEGENGAKEVACHG